MVTIKLIDPIKELTPAPCNPKIAISTEEPPCPSVLKGGYKVQLVPEPESINIEPTTKNKAIGSNQKLIAFIRGKLISVAPKSIGNIQFPKPPTNAGITIKKIIIKPWAVITLL